MNFKVFVGIDVSKAHVDVFIHGANKHAKCANNEEGFEKMMEWIIKLMACKPLEILIVFEHTGLYSLPLSLFLDQYQYHFSMIAGLELKRSMGITRGKDDKKDAKAIAEYAYEKREKIRLHHMASPSLRSLKRLVSYRERLVANRAGLKGRKKEYTAFLEEEENMTLFDSHQRSIDFLTAEIKQIEKEVNRLIEGDQMLFQQYQYINTIKCVGPQTAIMVIVLTQGFTQFPNWRKFASYSGIAPFPNESGTFKGKTRINHLANKRMKTLLSNCATSAIQYNPEMKAYFQRRVAEGKNQMSTLNIVRNKLLSRIFAVVNRNSPYVDTFKFAN